MDNKKLIEDTIKKIDGCPSVDKESIFLEIDIMHTDDGHAIYMVKDYYRDCPPDCTAGNGYYLTDYELEEDLDAWREKYNIIIKKDYR